ncbi:hypothetical protein [Ralstonia pseudosolanacearum]|uniref:hypothetical protein n=1 Tax=Ralstonia pseudosolanacearum TaxID=1310165 RepID=UPI001FFA7942|nr:hypothetical protein [Ralstonia pseudosolanacearum]
MTTKETAMRKLSFKNIDADSITLLIAKIKGKAWENWLQAQPFHKAGSKKTPHKSEVEMARDLADALAEIDG